MTPVQRANASAPTRRSGPASSNGAASSRSKGRAVAIPRPAVPPSSRHEGVPCAHYGVCASSICPRYWRAIAVRPVAGRTGCRGDQDLSRSAAATTRAAGCRATRAVERHLSVNHNKKSLAVDLKEEGLAIVHRLAEGADIVLQGFGGGTVNAGASTTKPCRSSIRASSISDLATAAGACWATPATT